eukprot:1158334-Pelagomonas_calceolata.AAC.3
MGSTSGWAAGEVEEGAVTAGWESGGACSAGVVVLCGWGEAPAATCACLRCASTGVADGGARGAAVGARTGPWRCVSTTAQACSSWSNSCAWCCCMSPRQLLVADGGPGAAGFGVPIRPAASGKAINASSVGGGRCSA